MQTTKSHSLAARVGLAFPFLIALVLVAPSCAKRDLRPLNPCTVSASSQVINVLPVEDIDLLFMVDNSESMAEEQAALQDQIDVIVRTLIDQDLIDALGIPGAQAVKRLRVGTVSSDLGVAGFGQDTTVAQLEAAVGLEIFELGIPGCGITATPLGVDPEQSRTGDRGVINLVPVSGTVNGITCPASYPSFLTFDVDEGQDVDQFVDDVSCTAVLGLAGCGFEFQLDSVLAAVTPSDSEITGFAYGTGVADLPYPDGNAGFFREEAVLAIVMITDEDDCSTDNPQVFNMGSTELTLDESAPLLLALGERYRFNTRCTNFSDQLYPISRYVNGLLAVKPANRLIFAAIVGVPPDAVDETAQEGVEGFDAILEHPDMQERDNVVDPSAEDPVWAIIPGTPANADSVVPACWRCLDPDTGEELPGITDFADCPAVHNDPESPADLQYAVPGTRIVQVARELRANGVISAVHTICTESFQSAVADILRKIALATTPSCLSRELNPDATGAVPCNFLETLPEGERCADYEGREPEPFKIEEDGRETCRLVQQIPTGDDRAAARSPEGLGWFYDDYTEATVGAEGTCVGRDVEAMVRFTDATQPASGATVRIDCLQPAQAEKDINTPCVSDSVCEFDDEDELSAFLVRWNLDLERFEVGGEQPMSCEATTNTCQIDCENDADCPGGMVCSEDDGNICLDPTCNVR